MESRKKSTKNNNNKNDTTDIENNNNNNNNNKDKNKNTTNNNKHNHETNNTPKAKVIDFRKIKVEEDKWGYVYYVTPPNNDSILLRQRTRGAYSSHAFVEGKKTKNIALSTDYKFFELKDRAVKFERKPGGSKNKEEEKEKEEDKDRKETPPKNPLPLTQLASMAIKNIN